MTSVPPEPATHPARTLLVSLVARARVWLREVGPRFWRFLVVGIGCTGADILLFNIFREVAHLPPLASKALSQTVVIVVTYGINRNWVFKGEAGKASSRQFILFTVVSFVTLAVAEICLTITYYGMDLRTPLETNLSANVVGTGLGTAVRFFCYRHWVFTDNEPAVELALLTTS